MNPQRTPPPTTLISGSVSGGGSVPNLSYDDENDTYQSRKRKATPGMIDYKIDFDRFRGEMMNFFKDFAQTQNENLAKIREEITEIKNEVKTIKMETQKFTEHFIKIDKDIEKIQYDNTNTQAKIKHIEKELSLLKTAECSQITPSQSSPLNQENLILELKERSEREKNIIMVGIPEQNEKNYRIRQTKDIEEFLKVTVPIIENCPKPIKSIRLGKYLPGKNRPLKIIFDNNETPKLVLRNKSKFPTHLKIYSDQTPSQNQYLQSIKEELRKRSESGEKDLTIKYIKGTPRIVEMKQLKN